MVEPTALRIMAGYLIGLGFETGSDLSSAGWRGFQITAHSSFELGSSNPVVSDGIDVLALGTRLFSFCRKELKIPDLHRVIVKETSV